MSTELGKAYEVLGVKPGVSDRELKAAHRDLAKVWHPDRFSHDPRLQQKAQEKLKEINEAYEQLISRHSRRVRTHHTASTARSQSAPAPVAPRRGGGWHWWIATSLVVFIAVFAITVKILLPRHSPAPSDEAADQLSQVESEVREDVSPSGRQRSKPETTEVEPIGVEVEPAQATITPVPTVTVSIDPETGLLATPACPVKTRMTYPSGSEPRRYCNLSHIVKPEKESRIKSLTKRVRSL